MGEFTLLRVIEMTLALGFAFMGVVILSPVVNREIHQLVVNDLDLLCTEKHFPLYSFTGFVPKSNTFKNFLAIFQLVSAFYFLFGRRYMKTYFTILLLIITSSVLLLHHNTGISPERSGVVIASGALLLVRLVLVRHEIKEHLHIE